MRIFGWRRIQFSVRSLLVLTGLLALSLAPVAWVARERQQVLRAREEAIRSVLLAERRRAQLHGRAGFGTDPTEGPVRDVDAIETPTVSAGVLIEHLRRENDELKDTVDSLRLEVQRLRAEKRR